MPGKTFLLGIISRRTGKLKNNHRQFLACNAGNKFIFFRFQLYSCHCLDLAVTSLFPPPPPLSPGLPQCPSVPSHLPTSRQSCLLQLEFVKGLLTLHILEFLTGTIRPKLKYKCPSERSGNESTRDLPRWRISTPSAVLSELSSTRRKR